MAIYNFKGMDKSGKELKSSVNAEGPIQAKQLIKAKGILLIELKEQKSEKHKSKRSLSFGNAVSIADLSLLTRQLATLIKAKIQIVEAISALVEQTENPKLRVALSEIKQKVKEGASLSQALSEYPTIFNNIYINMVEAGEASGTLEIVLLRLAEFTEAQNKLKTKIKGAMTYPVIMMVVGSLMIGMIFIFVIPKITKVFISMKKELPIQTKFCIWVSELLKERWWLIILLSFLSYYIFKKYIKTKSGKNKWHAFQLKLPILGRIITMINITRFSSTLATLLASGVPILTAMKIVTNLMGNVHMQNAVMQSRVDVSEGGSITSALVASGHFPPMVTHMIKLGEKSGEIEQMLNIIAENYQDQVDAELNGLTATLEPIMMVGMGLVVGFIIFSVVVPMMELNKI